MKARSDQAVVTRALGAFRNPATTFLIVAGVVGLVLVFLVPRFAGIDESGHFARAYQLTTGTIIPVDAPSGAPEGGGVCLPVPVAGAILRDEARNTVHLLAGSEPFAAQLRAAQAATRSSDLKLAASLPACGGGKRFLSIASFAWYSPLPYLPQAVAVGIVRIAGGGVGGMLLAGRLASLLAYLGIAWLAIRRSPAGRWALCVTALLPVALFQGATSLSPDAPTVAIALLVISSALRMTADSSPRLPRAFMVEAAALSVALGLCKPSYVVVALCYLLPLLGPMRRLTYWPLAIPVVLGLGVSAIWQASQVHLFVCDSRYFGAALDPARQRHDLLANPLRVVGAGCRAAVDYGDKWTGDLITIGARVVDWPVLVSVLVLLGFLLFAIQRDPAERFELHWQQRTFLFALFGLGYLAVILGWVIYCEAPPVHVGLAPHARLFVPGLALLPLALEITRGRAGRLAAAAIPVTFLLVPFEIVWLVALAMQMR
jgi:Predicted membrane protein (DUF2142)